MKKLLKQISEKAIKLGDFEFTQEQIKNKWLGTQPASESQISSKENLLGVEFPGDYKEFLSITNGFSAASDIEPTFSTIEKVDFLKNIDSVIVKAYSTKEIENIGKNLDRSICVGGILQEQYFLLIPPGTNSDKWKYWKFANWIPGEEEYESLVDYFMDSLTFMIEQIEEKN